MRLRSTDWSSCEAALVALSKLYSISNGSVGWSAAELDRWTFILAGHLQFEPRSDDDIRESVVWKAMNACAKAENFSPNFFRDRALEAAKELLARPKIKLTVLTEITLPKRIKIPRSVQTPLGTVHFDLRMRPREQKLYKGVDQKEKYGISSDFVILRADILSGSEKQVVGEGERLFNLVLGYLHLIYGGYGASIFTGMPRIPIGRLLRRSAVVSFDHKKNKFGNWYVPNHYQEQPKPHYFFPSSFSLADAPKEVLHYNRAIKKSDFGEKLLRAVTLFQEGISSRQSDVALLKLWTVFEVLCALDGERTTYASIITRAASIFPDVEATTQRLKFIKDARNGLVHRGDHDDFVSRSAQWASMYAAQIIKFCLFNISGLKSHSEIVEYLSLGTDVQNLDRGIRLARAKRGHLTTQKKRRAINQGQVSRDV
jgi:hypothetical protein